MYTFINKYYNTIVPSAYYSQNNSLAPSIHLNNRQVWQFDISNEFNLQSIYFLDKNNELIVLKYFDYPDYFFGKSYFIDMKYYLIDYLPDYKSIDTHNNIDIIPLIQLDFVRDVLNNQFTYTIYSFYLFDGIAPTHYTLPPANFDMVYGEQFGEYLSYNLADTTKDNFQQFFKFDIDSPLSILYSAPNSLNDVFDNTFDDTFHQPTFLPNYEYKPKLYQRCYGNYMQLKWLSRWGHYKTFSFKVVNRFTSAESKEIIRYTDTNSKIYKSTDGYTLEFKFNAADTYYLEDLFTSKETYILTKDQLNNYSYKSCLIDEVSIDYNRFNNFNFNCITSQNIY